VFTFTRSAYFYTVPHDILSGIDQLLQQHQYKAIRLALVTNNAAFTAAGIHSRAALLQQGFLLVKLFSPEHGLTAKGADGAFQHHTTDELTGLPVISLYGDRLAPAAADLADVDAVLFDIPDVGCRFYTYLWTMTHVMEACASYGKPLIIADRPNPVSGDLTMAEGPWLDEEACASFIGRWNIPVRHCCTLGELAQYFKASRIPALQMEVITVKNWSRDQVATKEGFVPTSPAIREPETALIYPGTGLLEGVNVNEGRGTEQPFRICGAPWIDAEALWLAFEKEPIDGLGSQPCSYVPLESLYAGQHCHGLQFTVTDPTKFRPVAMGLHLQQTIARMYPGHLEERLYRTQANPSGAAHLDKLLGVKDAFRKIKCGEIIFTEVASEWAGMIQPHLLY